MSPIRKQQQLERVVTLQTVEGPGDKGEENRGLVLGGQLSLRVAVARVDGVFSTGRVHGGAYQSQAAHRLQECGGGFPLPSSELRQHCRDRPGL